MQSPNLFQRISRRALGQILLDGKFVSKRALDRALREQKTTHELLGGVLVRMGVLNPEDVAAPLSIQQHLSHMENAVKLAAGDRQLLGALLVQSGRITAQQLDHAIAEQKKSGERLGEVFMRLGILTELQLKGLLDWQQNQAIPAGTPLRLGELLISTGHVTREQLESALAKQGQTGRKLGDILVAEGYVRRSEINHAVRLQKMCVNAVVAAIMAMGMSSAASASSVSLQWDPSPDTAVVGYKVHYQPDSTVQPFQGPAPVDVQNITTASIANLDPAHSYSFAVTAYNAAGEESAYSNVVTVAEMQAPTTAITYPSNSATVAGTVSVTADAADNVGVTKVEFYVNGALQATIPSSPYVYSWNTGALAPGSYTLMTKAYDAAGNIGQSQSVTVNVANDLTAPTVSLTSPGNNMTVSGSVNIAASASDNVGVSRVEFYLNNALLSATNMAPYSYAWNSKTVANGVYNLTAKAYDAAGNLGQSQVLTVNVSNDLIAPSVALSSPITGATVSGTVTVTASASDNVGVSKVEFYSNNVLQATVATAPYSYSWDTRTVANGSYTLVAKAFDAAGNATQSQSSVVSVSNDTTAPTVAVTSPTSGSTVSGTVTVTASASDNVGVSKVEFYRNGALVATSSAAPYAYSWNTTAVANGSYTLTAKAYDAAGNAGASQSTSVNVSNVTPDATAPTVAVTSPASGSTVSGTVTVTASASDNIGVSKVEFYRNGVLVATSSAAPYAYSWNTTAVANGSYTLTAKAYDAAGNAGISQSNAVNVSNPTTDTIAPTIAITSPATKTYVSGLVTIKANATDNVGVTKVDFFVSGKLVATVTQAPYSYVWDTTTVANNTSYTLSAKAYDAAGNTKQASNVYVTVKNRKR
ncbi:Ig-like domain-containing protein [Geomonas propionica]|uniref:Fibronectin type III domain-containing protein n=1 Tax=Geomonas propionica TaxID=2798582 RepID=A0ABS0YTY9_9BACT|nr:Ig-like domain-containing protein [Geomonas propionica]MBJ6801436.1 fibronectin type III domain-containing protein [Geomonas propionica]